MSDEDEDRGYEHYATAKRDEAFRTAYPEEAQLLEEYPDASSAEALRYAFEAGWAAKQAQHLDAVAEAASKFPPGTFTLHLTRSVPPNAVIATMRAPCAMMAGDSMQITFPRVATQTENGDGLLAVEVS